MRQRWSALFVVTAMSIVSVLYGETVPVRDAAGGYLGCGTPAADGSGVWRYDGSVPESSCGVGASRGVDPAWYLATTKIGDFDTTALHLLPPADERALFQTTQVRSDLQAGVGAIFRATDWLAIDIGVASARGSARRMTSQNGQTWRRDETDFRTFSGYLHSRLYLSGSWYRPWFGVGVRALALHPTSSDLVIGEVHGTPTSPVHATSTIDLASGLGVDVAISPRVSLSVSGDHAFRSGWQFGGAVILHGRPSRPTSRSNALPFAYDYPADIHTQTLDAVLAAIQDAATHAGGVHTPEALLALVDATAMRTLQAHGLARGGNLYIEARIHASSTTPGELAAIPGTELWSEPQRRALADIDRILQADMATPSALEDVARNTFRNLGPAKATPIVLAASVAAGSQDYWDTRGEAWSAALGHYFGDTLPFARFSWKNVKRADVEGAVGGAIGGGVTGGLSGAVIGGLAGAVGGSLGNVVGQMLFGRAAQLHAPLYCVPRDGFSCNEPGWRCLVMFPEPEWLAMRSILRDPPVVFAGDASIRRGPESVLHLEFSVPVGADISNIPVESAVSLNSTVAAMLGVDRLTILPRTYPIDRHSGRFGSVDFAVAVTDDELPVPANPEDDFGRFHNAGIRYFQAMMKQHPAPRLNDSTFAPAFHEVMTPWVREMANDPKFRRLLGATDAADAVAKAEALFQRIDATPSLRAALMHPATPPLPSGDAATIETYRLLTGEIRSLDAGCSSYEDYQHQVRAIEAQTLRDPDPSSRSFALQLISLARYSAALGVDLNGGGGAPTKFPWKDVLKSDLDGALTGAELGGFTGLGGSGAGAIIGGLFGSSFSLYDHGYIHD